MVIMYAYELFTIIQISSYIWMNSRLKGIFIESKNTQNGVLTKELCKLQAMKKLATCSTCSSSNNHWFLSFSDLL